MMTYLCFITHTVKCRQFLKTYGIPTKKNNTSNAIAINFNFRAESPRFNPFLFSEFPHMPGKYERDLNTPLASVEE